MLRMLRTLIAHEVGDSNILATLRTDYCSFGSLAHGFWTYTLHRLGRCPLQLTEGAVVHKWACRHSMAWLDKQTEPFAVG